MSKYCDSEHCDKDEPHEHNLDDYPCSRCDAAYPHPLLLDKHVVDEHGDEIQEVIDGENSITLG